MKTAKPSTVKEFIPLIGIFLLSCIVVLTNTTFDTNHACTKDSIEYLKLAQNLLNGQGYHVPAYGDTGHSRELFAIWPIGYPTLIFLVARVTGLSVLWASKVLNLGIVAIILATFRKCFGKDAPLYALLLLLYAPNVVFSTTLSEAPYTLGLLLFTFSIWKLLTADEAKATHYLALFGAFLVAFLSRYTGFILCGLMGVFAMDLLFLKGRPKDSLKLIGVATLCASVIVGYFYLNYQETGYTSGLERTFRSESLMQLSFMYLEVLLRQASLFASDYPLVMVIASLMMQYFIADTLFAPHKAYLKDKAKKLLTNDLCKVCLIVAAGYYACILGVRSIHSFHLYHVRLLYPGTLILLIGIVYSFRTYASVEANRALRCLLITLATLSILASAAVPSLLCSLQGKPTYKDEFAKWDALYKSLEDDTIVVFGMRHMNYRHLHVQIRQPREYPFYAHTESWDDFLKRVRQYERPLYLLTPIDELYAPALHPSVMEVVNSFEPGTLVDLNTPGQMKRVDWQGGVSLQR